MLIDGRPATTLPLADRGLAYGDGLFETIRVTQGRLLYPEQHFARLAVGCARLGLSADFTALRQECTQALQQAASAEGVLKIMLTRATGGRGYRPAIGTGSTRILTLHPLPDYSSLHPETGIKTFLCQQRLAHQPVLAGLKHLNRLEQVLASREWPDDSFLEGLMLDSAGLLIEGTRSNVFLVYEGRLLTPSLHNCGVDGIMRQVLLGYFGTAASVVNCPRDWLHDASELFVCNSVVGVWPVRELHVDGTVYHYTSGPQAQVARDYFLQALQS